MSYRLINSNEIAIKYPEVNDMPCIYADLPNGLDGEHYNLQEPKTGKWDRLYSWLNDMRLGIAPDETVTDIDERNCRESQTDILDEIMEWMIKAESEDKE